MNATSPSKKEQMIWALSDLSNINAGKFYSSEDKLQTNADQIKTVVSGTNPLATFLNNDFSVVWGPALVNERVKVKVSDLEDAPKSLSAKLNSKVTGYTSTNTMFVAKGSDPVSAKPLYIIAIAGTNVVSKAGWFDEDFAVGSTTAWPPSYIGVTGIRDAGNIAKGSDEGLKGLWNMTDPETGKSLIDFITPVINETNGAAEIATCGHSLGGALSPLVALALCNHQYFYNSTISTYPTAGPTSGDATYANYAAKTFNGNYHSRVNRYDFVPHAWADSDPQRFDMTILDSIYANFDFLKNGSSVTGLPSSAVIKGFICWAKARRKGNTYSRIQPDMAFDGTPVQVDYNLAQSGAKTILKKSSATTAFTEIVKKCGGNTANLQDLVADFVSYGVEIGLQHTVEYGKEFLGNEPLVLAEIAKYASTQNLSTDAKAEAQAIVQKLVTDVYTYYAFGGSCC